MELAEAIEEVRPTIVQVCVRAKPGRFATVGTGFIVDETAQVVTADHVVEARDQLVAAWSAPDASLCVGLAQPNADDMRGNFTIVDCEVGARDQRHDVAVLRLLRNPFGGEVTSGVRIGDEDYPLLFGAAHTDARRPRDGDRIASSGYPLSSPVLLTTAGHVASAWAYDVGEGTATRDIADEYIADMTANAGNSGGPIYSVETGAVIGVCVAYRTAPLPVTAGSALAQNSGLTVIVPIQYALDLV